MQQRLESLLAAAQDEAEGYKTHLQEVTLQLTATPPPRGEDMHPSPNTQILHTNETPQIVVDGCRVSPIMDRCLFRPVSIYNIFMFYEMMDSCEAQ